MQDLVTLHNKQAVTTSLILAESFEKKHKHVLDAISSKISTAENSALYKNMFSEATYTASNGKQNKMYYMNRDGFTFIAMGFTGKKADEFKLKYIDAFNQMERQIAHKQDSYAIDDPVERAERWIEEQKQYQIELALANRRLKDEKENRLISSKEYQLLSRKIDQKLNSYITVNDIYNRNQLTLLRYDLNHQILQVAGVPARTLIRQKDFVSVVDVLINWEPTITTLEKLKVY